MSTTLCIRCDQCDAQIHRDPLLRPGEWHLPESWLSVIPGDTQLHTAWHFCSMRCLYMWSGEQPKGKQRHE